MSRQRQPSLRLLSLNVNGLRSADKRRTLFSLLHRDRWDVVLLQETHHTDDAEAQAWTQEGPHGLRPNWSGPSFWCHGSPTSRGVAILLRPAADIADITLRHQAEDGRALSIDFSFAGGSIHGSQRLRTLRGSAAGSLLHTYTAAQPPQQTDSSSSAATSTALPGSWMCWAQTAQSSAAPQATTMVSGSPRPTDSSLTSGETGTQTGRPSHTLAASHQPVWTDGLSQSSCDPGSAQPLTLLTRQQDTQEITRVSPSASQLQAAHTLAEAAWRMPLHLLDDEGFCTEIADVITAYLREHPTSELLSRGQRWVHLKRHLRLRATTSGTADGSGTQAGSQSARDGQQDGTGPVRGQPS